MKTRHILAILLLLIVLSFSSVHAQVSVPNTGTLSSQSFLSGLTSGNPYIYAGFFAIVMFIIFAIALDRTQLSSGGIAISFIFALITFFLLYTDNTLLHFFLNTFIVLAFIALIIGMLAAVKSPRSIRLIGLIVALFLIIILFQSDAGLTNSINSILHINILSILPLVFGIITVFVFIILLLRTAKTHNNILLRVILLFIVFLLIALLIPGFAGFIFSPIVLVPLFVAILLGIFLFRRGIRHGPKLSKQEKKEQKEANVQNKVLSSIAKRKQSNGATLQEYRNLLKKGNLTPEEQLRMAQLKNKLANEAWQNVADRTKLTNVQYSKQQLSNNKDLQKLTGFFSRSKALKDLKSNAEKNYKLSSSQKRALKQQQKAERQKMLEEQARLAEAARQEAEHEKTIKEQQVSSQNIGNVGPNTAFDKRVKPPLWFSPKSPVDKNGKLDVQMQNEIEARGLMDRRENLVSLINSGRLSGRQLKDAKNELNRIDYRLKKYGRDIHR